MRLAIDTATARASVALGRSAADVRQRELAGARRHASALLPMIEELLRSAGLGVDALTGIVLSDGPGSFTGLRVGAAVAKALARARGLPLWSAPSLLVRAAGIARPGDTVLAVADALRGEVYAALYRFDGDAILVELVPSVRRPEELLDGPVRPTRLVGEVPEEISTRLESWAGTTLIRPPEGAPQARVLLGLVDRTGGAIRVANVQDWEPEYGRPAEAQARWETAHGRRLPDSIGSPG